MVASWEHRDMVSSSNLANKFVCDLRGKPHSHSHFLVGIISKSCWISKSSWLPRVVRRRKNSKGKALCSFWIPMHPPDPESVWERELLVNKRTKAVWKAHAMKHTGKLQQWMRKGKQWWNLGPRRGHQTGLGYSGYLFSLEKLTTISCTHLSPPTPNLTPLHAYHLNAKDSRGSEPGGMQSTCPFRNGAQRFCISL